MVVNSEGERRIMHLRGAGFGIGFGGRQLRTITGLTATRLLANGGAGSDTLNDDGTSTVANENILSFELNGPI